MRKGAKISLAVILLCSIVVVIGLVLYISLQKNTYRVAAVEHTTYQASDFQNSELKLYNNGTFHVQIIYQDNTVFFLGIGTYVKNKQDYELIFTQAVGAEGEDVVDQMDHFTAPLKCQRSGNRIKFTDHNHQIYYFG